jgi:hypothetical protein
MQESNHDFYLWRHRYVDNDNNIVCRTCFGITSNRDNRQNGYEGHVGHPVVFEKIWSGPERLIRELETKVKQDFADYLFQGHRNFVYEWITEEVDFDTIVKYIEWEIGNLDGVELTLP